MHKINNCNDILLKETELNQTVTLLKKSAGTYKNKQKEIFSQ